jgi:hypothetical protein
MPSIVAYSLPQDVVTESLPSNGSMRRNTIDNNLSEIMGKKGESSELGTFGKSNRTRTWNITASANPIVFTTNVIF